MSEYAEQYIVILLSSCTLVIYQNESFQKNSNSNGVTIKDAIHDFVNLHEEKYRFVLYNLDRFWTVELKKEENETETLYASRTQTILHWFYPVSLLRFFCNL